MSTGEKMARDVRWFGKVLLITFVLNLIAIAFGVLPHVLN